MYVDWSDRGEYMRQRHGIEVASANEAIADVHAVWLDPDTKSKSGRGVRVIGFSRAARTLVTVILLRQGASDLFWGVNGWPSNAEDRKRYERA